MLELDHVFCVINELDQTADRLKRRGWLLDEGTVHTGQGTRNRRLLWPEQYLELLEVADYAEARANPLRFDLRAEWRSTGASPFGLVFRGQLPDEHRKDFVPYTDLGPLLWVHRDNLRGAARPQVFVLDTTKEDLEQRRPRSRRPNRLAQPRSPLHEVRVCGPERARLPPHTGPSVMQSSGSHHLELVAGDGPAQPVNQILTLRA
ncbi:MAG: VOC family protein [Solirubrobacterales bacterium]|nr:VOC family protein [Solirubrobacterales bacterium]